jgi:hypothetical protein
VTDSLARMSRLNTRPPIGGKRMVPKLAPRDASTILDVKGHHVTFMDAPKSVAVEPLEVLNLSETPAVLTPSLFAQPGKWGRRALSFVEVLKAKDLGADNIVRLAEFELKNEVFEALIPGKCLTEGFKALVNGGVKENEMVFEMTKKVQSAKTVQLKATSERTSERATGQRKERENDDAADQ